MASQPLYLFKPTIEYFFSLSSDFSDLETDIEDDGPNSPVPQPAGPMTSTSIPQPAMDPMASPHKTLITQSIPEEDPSQLNNGAPHGMGNGVMPPVIEAKEEMTVQN